MSSAARTASENKTVRPESNFIPYEEVVEWAKNPPVLKTDTSAIGWTLGAAACVVFIWYYFVYRPSLLPSGKKAADPAEETEEEPGTLRAADSETDLQSI